MEKIISEKIPTPKGRWWDEIWKKDENGVEYKAETTEIKNNLIVISFSALLSGLLANDSLFFGGILFHALGEGEASWDVSLPPPDFNDTQLTNEFYRQAPDSITYFDGPQGSGGVAVASVNDARTILIQTTFDFGVPADPINGNFIRTHGLVGGNATSTANSGFFLDIINHKAIFKDSSVKLTRFIEISLG